MAPGVSGVLVTSSARGQGGDRQRVSAVTVTNESGAARTINVSGGPVVDDGNPFFQDLGTNVSEQLSAAIAGQKSVTSALAQAQEYAQAVGDTYRTG